MTKGPKTKKFVGIHTLLYPGKKFGSHAHSRLQAQKGVSRVGLEAQLLTLEHLLVKRYCCEYYEETISCYRLLDPTLKTSYRSKRCSQSRSVGPAIDFRASIDKKVLLGLVKAHFHLWIYWLTPSLPAPG